MRSQPADYLGASLLSIQILIRYVDVCAGGGGGLLPYFPDSQIIIDVM